VSGGDVGKKHAGIPLGRMARHLGREESYLLKHISTLSQALDPNQQSDATIDAIIQELRSPKSGFLD
jgi:hypothetical protein